MGGTGREQEPGGDYGYDLVHRDVGEAGAHPDAGDGTPPPPSGGPDPAGDHSYDEAHDF